MTQYIRYFIFIVSFLLSLTGYALDHIVCTLTNNGITGQLQAGQEYINSYTCTNTYPNNPRFPAIKLGLLTTLQSGAVQSLQVAGSCADQPLASGGTCQFQLALRLQQSAVLAVKIVIGAGLYTIQQPVVVASVATPPPPPSSPRINWPGFNSGFAQSDVTQNGFGGFIANATDSSGHPITYIFEILSGPGTIFGYQSGFFSLTGVSGSTVVRIIATADDAPPVFGTPFTVSVSTVPLKVLAFFNNTPETIYPVIEAPILTVDDWLQGYFNVPNLGTDTFQATSLHRVYVNGLNGILPGQTAVVSVPFYSFLVPNPSPVGNVPNQYVDWWKSMRVYLYDVQSNLAASQSEPGVTPVILPGDTQGPACVSGCSQTPIFSAPTIIKPEDPQQLLEYTFADVVTAVVPYQVNLTTVNYDISAVDQTYLPTALALFGSNLIGYTGTIVDLNSYRTSLTNFLAETAWPQYAGLPYPRIPSAATVTFNAAGLTNTAAQNLAFQNYWINCPNTVDAANCNAVFNMFNANYIACNGVPLPGGYAALPMTNLYGYVSFCIGQPLPSSGPGFNEYTNLQYNFTTTHLGEGYAAYFNPYTALIHQTLVQNIYAYSVDDAVGFIRAIGNGLIIAIGGPNGLSNTAQIANTEVTTITPGVPPTNPFTHYGVCSSTPSNGQIGAGAPILLQIPQSSYPCEITLQDSVDRLYHFTLNNAAPLTSTAVDISCAPGDTWCSNVQVVLVPSGNGLEILSRVSTPPPTP